MNKTFSSPVNAGNYIAGFGNATGCKIRSINYDTGEVRFSLVGASGESEAVNGIRMVDGDGNPNPSEATVAAAVRAEVDATNA